MKTLISASLLCLAGTLPVLADCGETPMMSAAIPEGETATAEDIRAARANVLKWSDEVDAWIACMDREGVKMLPWLTKEQQARREEDLANLHNKRRDAQVALNNAIRTWRAGQKKD